MFLSPRRDASAARRCFDRAIATTRTRPTEVVTDRAATYPIVLDEVLPGAWHRTERYANNQIEADHGRLKARLRPMRGLKQDRSARIIIAGHASLRTSAAATTNSQSTRRRADAWPWRWASWPQRSDATWPSRIWHPSASLRAAEPGMVRRELLDRVLIVGRRHVEVALTSYVVHYNEHRPHRSLGQAPPLGALPSPLHQPTDESDDAIASAA